MLILYKKIIVAGALLSPRNNKKKNKKLKYKKGDKNE